MSEPEIDLTDLMATDYAAGLSLAEVGTKYGISLEAVRRRFIRRGIPRRPRARIGAANGRWTATPTPNGGRQRAARALPNPDACSECGSTKNLHRHHIDGDTSNNTAENLAVLCARCHIQAHREEERLARTGTRFRPGPEHVEEWRRRKGNGETVRSIARDFPVAEGTIHYYLSKDRAA